MWRRAWRELLEMVVLVLVVLGIAFLVRLALIHWWGR